MKEFLEHLHIARSPKIEMEKYQAGIDNMHVDVRLSQKFLSALYLLVGKMVHEELSRQGYSEAGNPPTKNLFDDFKEAYRGLLEGALEYANESLSLADYVQLLQLTLLKILLESPGKVIDGLRSQLQQDADTPSRDHSGRSLELHDRLVSIAKFEPGVRYRTLRRLFKVVQQIESKELRKVRKSMLGISWVLPKQLLFNPLLHLPNLTTETYLMNHYPILCVDSDDGGYFSLTNRLFCEHFEEFLPDWAQPAASDHTIKKGPENFQIRHREWRGGFSEFLDGHRMLERSLRAEEFESCKYTWMDTPNNVDLLWWQSVSGSWLNFSKADSGKSNRILDDKEWAGFNQRQTAELHKRLVKAGVLQRAIASYRTLRLYRQLRERVPIRDIYQYLSGVLARRKLVKRLSTLPSAEGDEALRAMDAVYHYLRRMPKKKQQEYALRYLKDFLTFRRDLKLAHFAHQQMSYIRLLQNAEDINLSRDNHTLYEFRLRSETESAERKIRAHVVLKADIRGSTEITRQLMETQLNPATHFSLNFFGPINKLLRRFGAQKVFVEGDALILTVLEFGDMGGQAMTVANACGLACKILSVMKFQNQQNRNHNLPKLELGLGIAYSNDSPTFLYDDRRKIMISSAINQADRLSSCSAELRNDTSWKRSKRHCVEELCADVKGESQQKLLRYNVNGIDLDPSAFTKLRKELAMHKVRLQSSSGTFHKYYAGRFIDRQGSSHWLVIREDRVKSMQGSQHAVAGQENDQYFYEVVTYSDLIGQVKAKLRSNRKTHGRHARVLKP